MTIKKDQSIADVYAEIKSLLAVEIAKVKFCEKDSTKILEHPFLDHGYNPTGTQKGGFFFDTIGLEIEINGHKYCDVWRSNIKEWVFANATHAGDWPVLRCEGRLKELATILLIRGLKGFRSGQDSELHCQFLGIYQSDSLDTDSLDNLLGLIDQKPIVDEEESE